MFHHLHALCAYVRCMYVALCMVLFWPRFDVIFADQVSAVDPVLKLKTSSKILFYCHFPDLLLAHHTTHLQKLYRAPLNWIEETTTGLSLFPCTHYLMRSITNMSYHFHCLQVHILNHMYHHLTHLPVYHHMTTVYSYIHTLLLSLILICLSLIIPSPSAYMVCLMD